eukprot:10074759-Karenia_brevis.AAC.1
MASRASSSSSAAEPPVDIIVNIAKEHGLTAAGIYELTDEAIVLTSTPGAMSPAPAASASERPTPPWRQQGLRLTPNPK